MNIQDRGELLAFELEEVYDDSLLNTAYQDLTETQINDGEIDPKRLHETMDKIIVDLHGRRMNSSDQEWKSFVKICKHHPLQALLHQDMFTQRAYAKPRGYAGDAVLLDYIYGREEHWPAPDGMTPFGQQLFDYTTQIPATEAVRARRGFLADLLDKLADEVNKPHVLSIAAGHCREALISAAVKRKKFGRFVALDSDTQSLEEVNRCYARYGIEVKPASVRQILTDKVQLGEFDLVYSTGLYDYVQQSMAQRLTEALFHLVRPGGSLLLANFMPGIRDIGYMESFMEWELIYRTRHEMLDMSMKIPQPDISDIRIFAEENEHVIFLKITKRDKTPQRGGLTF
jgi:extracellular factor (EF) 3-hydroxypalmitic acid methyl ester biosynthesis protein